MNSLRTEEDQYHAPFNFDPKDKRFDIFVDHPFEFFPAPKIEIVHNARINNNSVIFKFFKIFRESCIGEENYKKYQNNFLRFYFKFIFPKFNFSRKRFLLITDEWTSNYYHWHIMALGRLVVLQDAGLLKNSFLFLPKKYQNYGMVMPSLKAFGIKENQVVFLRRKSNIKVAEVPIVAVSQHHVGVYRKICETLRQNASLIASDVDFGDKIYISREGQRSRYAENESEVVALLESYGFKKIRAEKFSYSEQVAISSKAKYLISPHGAGLTNMLFMKKGNYVLELANKSKAVKPVTDYYRMAEIIGVNYLYQECEMGEDTKSITSDSHEGSLHVDLAELEKNLKLMNILPS
jgi:capsular polysaccharide biosynthesis protein